MEGFELSSCLPEFAHSDFHPFLSLQNYFDQKIFVDYKDIDRCVEVLSTAED